AISELELRADRIPPAWRAVAGVDQALESLHRGDFDFSCCTFTGSEIPRLDPAHRLVPIESWDELVDLASRLVERIDSHDDLERLFDGVSRLCDLRPADFVKRTAPLLRRILQIIERQLILPFADAEPAHTLLGVLLAWLQRDYGTINLWQDEKGRIEGKYTLGDLSRGLYPRRIPLFAQALCERGHELADRILRRCAVATLCAPTHRGGWIEPRELVVRVSQPRVLAEATDLEQVLALLRLAPEGRAEAARQLPKGGHPFLAALEATLIGGDRELPPSLPEWLALASRSARGDKNTRVTTSFQFQPPQREGSAPIRLTIEPTPAPPAEDLDLRLLPTCRWHLHDLRDWSDSEGVEFVRQQFLVHPVNPTPTIARGALRIAANLDWWQVEWANRHYLEPLLDPDVPLDEIGHLLLTVGLAAKQHGEATLATDIAIAACDDGRLDPSRLGAVLNRLLSARFILAARVARTLGQVARVSAVHEECVRIAFTSSLRGASAVMPRDLHALVELLSELVIATQTPVDAGAREFLKQLTGSSKLARSARKILEFDRQPDPARGKELQMQIVSARLDRAERWLSRIAPSESTCLADTL
ncbi:MAG: DUF6493 family protein, partial [Planctomycetota bacterium]|nr:DUF6493 family protein [Planctomycetota bacterium]